MFWPELDGVLIAVEVKYLFGDFGLNIEDEPSWSLNSKLVLPLAIKKNEEWLVIVFKHKKS